MMNFSQTLLLSKSEVTRLISLSDAIESIEKVFQCLAENLIYQPPVLHADVAEGEFHIKAGGCKKSSSPYFTTKINGGFFSHEAFTNLFNNMRPYE